MIIRNCSEEDVDKIRIFVSECKPLDLHTSITYWTLFKYFPNLCYVMLENDKVIGFVSGLRSSLEKDVVYLWQIGINKEHRGKSYASTLIEYFIKSAINLNCNKIQFTIAPENESSYNAFLKYSKEHSYPISKMGEAKYYDSLTDNNYFEIMYQITV